MKRSFALPALIIVMMAAVASAAPRKNADSPSSKAPPASVSSDTEAQVVLGGQSLFPIRGKVLSFSPEDRARTISGRLSRLAKDPLFHTESIKVIESESSSDIVSGDLIIMSVAEGDAKSEGKPRPELAEEYAAKIRTAVEARNKEYSIRSILFGALYTFLATLILIVTIIIINRFLPKTISTIESWRGTFIRSVKFQSIEVLNEERISATLISTVRGIRVVLLLGLFYLYIPLVLSFFPWTRGMASNLFNYILTPLEKAGHAFISYLPNIFFLAGHCSYHSLHPQVNQFRFFRDREADHHYPGLLSRLGHTQFQDSPFFDDCICRCGGLPLPAGSRLSGFQGGVGISGSALFTGIFFGNFKYRGGGHPDLYAGLQTGGPGQDSGYGW